MSLIKNTAVGLLREAAGVVVGGSPENKSPSPLAYLHAELSATPGQGAPVVGPNLLRTMVFNELVKPVAPIEEPKHSLAGALTLSLLAEAGVTTSPVEMVQVPKNGGENTVNPITSTLRGVTSKAFAETVGGLAALGYRDIAQSILQGGVPDLDEGPNVLQNGMGAAKNGLSKINEFRKKRQAAKKQQAAEDKQKENMQNVVDFKNAVAGADERSAKAAILTQAAWAQTVIHFNEFVKARHDAANGEPPPDRQEPPEVIDGKAS